MDKERVRYSRETSERLVFIGAHRFVRQVAARGNHRKSEIMEENVMEGGVGQHDPEIRVMRGDGGREIPPGCLPVRAFTT
jgi:hypothetical protein